MPFALPEPLPPIARIELAPPDLFSPTVEVNAEFMNRLRANAEGDMGASWRKDLEGSQPIYIGDRTIVNSSPEDLRAIISNIPIERWTPSTDAVRWILGVLGHDALDWAEKI